MSQGLYSGVSGLAIGVGLYKGTQGLWSGASGLITGDGGSTLSLNFLAGAPLDNRITFTRASTATFVGSDGLIQSAAIDTPRFDYDPANLTAKGLLIEEQRTNLLLYSAEFDNAAWTKTALTVTANAATAPDGTESAEKLTGNTTASAHQCQQVAVASATLGTTYTFSMYLKAAEYGFAFIGFGGTAFVSVPYISVNLSTGAVATTNGFPVSSSATSVGNGWWRVRITGITDVAAGTVVPDIRTTADGVWANRNNAQDGTSGIYAYGAQLEAGAFATSYIPTSAAQVTRAADIAQMTGTNFSSWYNQSEGTFVVGADVLSTNATRVWMDVGPNGAFGTTAYIGQVPSNIALLPGAAPVNMVSTVAATALSNTVAIGLQTNNSVFAANGILGTADTSCTMPASATQLVIGSAIWNLGGGASLNGHIRSITYYPTRLPDATLQSLTS